MIEWLRKRIIKWLGLDKTLKQVQGSLSRLESKVTQVQVDQAYLTKMLRVGVDVHFRSKSWAVICIEGRPDFVKMIEWNPSELYELRKFMKVMEKRGAEVRLDSPIGFETGRG